MRVTLDRRVGRLIVREWLICALMRIVEPQMVTAGAPGCRFGGGGRRSPPGRGLAGRVCEDAADVGLDGLLADGQVPGDLPVAVTAGDQPEYVAFAR
jgi:hypothetical protein